MQADGFFCISENNHLHGAGIVQSLPHPLTIGTYDGDPWQRPGSEPLSSANRTGIGLVISHVAATAHHKPSFAFAGGAG